LDKSGRVYLADFGIARILEGSTVITRTGIVTGTPQYMAPEQAMGQPVTIARIAGVVPFSADTPMAVLMKHLREPIPLEPLRELPGSLQSALLRAMAKEPADRFSSATAFVEALKLGLDGPADRSTVSQESRSTEPSHRFRSRSRGRWARMQEGPSCPMGAPPG
jgi:serine/threonine protein kinase